MSPLSRRARPVKAVKLGSRLTGRGQRVALRPLEEGDRETVARRLEETPVDADDSLLVITSREGGSTYGVLAYRLDQPEEGSLSFDLVAVELGFRGLGFDSEAVRLLEGEALEWGLASRFWVGVRHDEGLGLYFWLRLGYRPAAAGENPWAAGAPRDMMAMIRVPTA